MDDLALDRELQAVLGTDPSPGFLARARARIAQAPRPSLFAGWIAPAAAIACAVLVVGVALERSNGREGRDATAGVKPRAAGTSMADLKAGTTPSMADLKAGTTPSMADPKAGTTSKSSAAIAVVVPTLRPARMATEVAVEPPLPEVIIAPADVEALRQFLAAATETRFVASFDPTPAPIPWAIPEPVDHNN